jgi:hypothetical protein
VIARGDPFAHYLALREHSAGRFSDDDGELLGLVERCVQSSDTVRFYWTCEALADRQVTSAIPILSRLAQVDNPPGLHGPAGMGRGYPVARAVGRLAGVLEHAHTLLRGQAKAWTPTWAASQGAPAGRISNVCSSSR